MRLVVVGTSRPEIERAVGLARSRGALVRHLPSMAAALGQLRAGQGADLLMLRLKIGRVLIFPLYRSLT